jgi:2,3-bisphosphoglycerate-dependent phosphoglycerate mutase
MDRTIYLIRHAKSEPQANLPETEWPLGEFGRQQALSLKLSNLGLERIFTSPYPRAVDTVTPLANFLKLNLEVEHDLRERKLTDDVLEDWYNQVIKTWEDFDYKLPGGESNRDCQIRITNCLKLILQKTTEKTIAVSSHGNAISMFLHSIDPRFSFEDWKKMKNPDVFKLVGRENLVHWDKDFHFD